MSRQFSINPCDSRCDPSSRVTVCDSENGRIVSHHANMIDAIKARALLTYDQSARFGDPAMSRFPIGDADATLESVAALNAHEYRWQSYSRADYLAITEVVRSAFVKYFGVMPDIRDPDDPDDEPDFDPDDDPNDDPDDDGGDDEEPDDRLRDGTPYSSAYFTMLSKPTMGEFEQRCRPWVPATPADRRPWR